MTVGKLIDTGPSPRGWHRLESVLRCAQLYAWGYGQRGGSDRFPSAAPLVRGTLGHVALAHLYARLRCVQEGQDPEEFLPAHEAIQAVAERFGDLGASQLPIVGRAVKAYLERYRGDAERYRVLGVERLLETDFLGYRYTARVDLEFEDAAGRVWLADHKFVHRIEGKAFRRYTMSGQFLGLTHLGAKEWGPRFGGVLLNLVGCQEPHSFAREPVDSAPWQLERFPMTVVQAEERIAALEEAIDRGLPAPASPSEFTCWTPYGPCPAFEACRFGKEPGSA